MAGTMKIRATENRGLATVNCVMKHPMETGLRKDRKTGEKIPARYITEVACELNGNGVMTAYLGPDVSRNPSLSFEINNAKKGDTVKITWWDTTMKSVSGEAKVT